MATIASPRPPLGRRLSTYLYQRPRLILLLLLAPPLIWLGVVYLGSLGALMIQSLFRLDSFTGQVVPELTLQNYAQLFSEAHIGIMARTTIMAAVVTLFSIGLAFPLAYFMARYASPRAKSWLYLLVLIPLWSSYLVRVFAWKLILAKEGVLTWFLHLLGLGGALDRLLAIPGIGGTSLAVSNLGMFIVFVYVWLPYMILPIQASLERVPKSLLEASSDLGARPGYTFRSVILPLAMPGIVAGSIFTFSLTLGDFVVPYVIGNSSPFVGLAVYAYQGTSGNIPLAAALTVFPMIVMIIYLAIARKLGAFEAL